MILAMKQPTTFAAWLKDRRLRAGLTQDQLAGLGGFDDSYINKLERGRITLPQYDTRQRIHAALGTSEDELIDTGIVRAEHRQRQIPATVGVREAPTPFPPGDERNDLVAILEKITDRKMYPYIKRMLEHNLALQQAPAGTDRRVLEPWS